MIRSCLVLIAALLTAAMAPAATGTRPDIVFIYCDDLRWDSLGVVQREQGDTARFPWLQTPRLDVLAAQSVRFRASFVTTSLCSPGRASVMTSRYGHHNGIIGNTTPLPADSVTFPRHLREAGYTTAFVGKWHMGTQRDRPHFDYHASFVGQGRYNDCPLLVDGVETPTQGWVDDVTAEYAARFVAAQPKDKPFFLWLGFKSPHGPRGGENLPERVRGLYANDASRPTQNTGLRAIYNPGAGGGGGGRYDTPTRLEAHRDFNRHATAIDTSVGRLLDALVAAGRADNTLIIFTSDNGYYLGEHGLGDKRTAYEESIRVPLLVRLPGAAAARGVTNDAMVLNLDYGPTILDFAGAKPLPEAQGRSLRPLLEGRSPADWRTEYFYEYFKEPPYAPPTVLALRTTTHKLVVYPGHEEWTQVFDLASDPYETRNLAGDAELRAKLQAAFDRQAQAVGFTWPAGWGPKGESPPAPANQKKK